MNLEQLEKRVADLARAVEESAGRHNILCGHKAEAEYMLAEMKKEAECVKENDEQDNIV